MSIERYGSICSRVLVFTPTNVDNNKIYLGGVI